MFQKESISDYYRNLIKEIRSSLLRESDAQIVGTTIEELSQYYFQEYSLSPIVFDSSRDTTWLPENYVKNICANERESGYEVLGDLELPCQRIKVEIPILPNKDINKLANLNSSTYYLRSTDIDFLCSINIITFVFETKGYGHTMNDEAMATAIKNGIQRVHEVVDRKNNDINKENINLLIQISNLIDERKNEITRNKAAIEALTQKINIPIKRIEPQGARKIIIDQKPLVKKIKPTVHLPEEYVLDEIKVNEILEVIDNLSKSFEKTPNALASLGEEDLRDIILANINSIFQGKATGETFSNKGKTDIYLNIDKGNILIFECKIWGGRKLFYETIDQLRGYLTWRHNYGVVIFFVKLKYFTKILSDITTYIQESSSYLNNAKKINDTHFISNHRLDDDDKSVKIHYLFYNLFS